MTRRHGPEQYEEGPGPLFAHSRSTDPATSKAAAASLDSKALNCIESRVMDAYREAGSRGLTTIELSERTGLDRVTVSPRIKPLVERGLLENSGETRKGPSGKSSVAWRIT